MKVNAESNATDTAKAISQLLDRRNIQRQTPTIRDPENFLGKRELDALLAVLAIFSVVGLVTSGFLVANTLAAIVTEQVSEIGTIKALGGTRGQVMLVYLMSALVYGIIGTALGLAIGTFRSWSADDFIWLAVEFDGSIFASRRSGSRSGWWLASE